MNKMFGAIAVIGVIAIVGMVGFAIYMQASEEEPMITAIEFSEYDPLNPDQRIQYAYYVTMTITGKATQSKVLLDGVPELLVYYDGMYLGKAKKTDTQNPYGFYNGQRSIIYDYDFSGIYTSKRGDLVRLVSTGEYVPYSSIHWYADLSTIPDSWKAKMTDDCIMKVV